MGVQANIPSRFLQYLKMEGDGGVSTKISQQLEKINTGNSLDSTVSNASIALSRLNPISESLSIESSLGANGSEGSASPSTPFCPSNAFKEEIILLALSFAVVFPCSGGGKDFPPASKLKINSAV